MAWPIWISGPLPMPGQSRAAGGLQKRALLAARLAQAPLMGCAIDVFLFERRRFHARELRGPLHVVLSQIDVARLIAAAGASAPAGEAEAGELFHFRIRRGAISKVVSRIRP